MKCEIFGLSIFNMSFHVAVDTLSNVLEHDNSAAKIVVTPNVDHLVRLHRNQELFQQYREADYVFADGFPIVVASKFLQPKNALFERVTGADLFPAICQRLSNKRKKFFLLGGHPGKEVELKGALQKKYPGAQIEVYSPQFGFTSDSSDAIEAVNRINDFKPDVTFVCLGMPRQELWSFKYRDFLATKLICCFGAAFEFDLGIVKRAPLFLQKIGLEWLWRLMGNPKKLGRRYLYDDPYFLRLVWDEILGKKKKSNEIKKGGA